MVDRFRHACDPTSLIAEEDHAKQRSLGSGGEKRPATWHSQAAQMVCRKAADDFEMTGGRSLAAAHPKLQKAFSVATADRKKRKREGAAGKNQAIIKYIARQTKKTGHFVFPWIRGCYFNF